MNSLSLTAVVVVVIALSDQSSSALIPQYSQFFPINACNGPHIYSFETIDDFQKFSNQTVLGYTQRGLWIYEYIRGAVTVISTVMDATSSHCVLLMPGDKLVSAKRVFNSDLDIPEIGLFSEKFYDITHHYITVEIQTEFSLRLPMDVKSVAFTGIRSFTVFPNTDFTGISTCLTPRDDDPLQRGYQITGKSDLPMTIGSIRLGCVGEAKSIISSDAENSQPTSINDNVRSKSVIDSAKNEAHLLFQ